MVRQRTEYLRGKIYTCRTDGSYDVKLTRSPQKIIQRLAPELLAPDDGEDIDTDDELEPDNDPVPKTTKKNDSDDDFEPEFSRGDRIEARFGGQTTYYPGTIERVHANGSYDISYDDGDEEERVARHLIRPVSKQAASVRKPSDNYDSDFDSD
ncbi:Hypothetical protein PHPALM_9552 [Phytophthora palmivora]|uniref:Tudor domain-containing protein n=1 Tax=Phytophthora palmivora TaxID=4796 RepID=A0A2P4Y6Z6_9STRA|nr:Hypothetical protein PHPALM_9552 [Phytophthora palmivora]